MGKVREFFHEVNRGFVHSITGGMFGQSTKTGEVGWLESAGRPRSDSVIFGKKGSGHAPSDWHGNTRGAPGPNRAYTDRQAPVWRAWPGAETGGVPSWQDPGGVGRVENPNPPPGYHS